jgi:MFS superfamily sulfate permease-like transporter
MSIFGVSYWVIASVVLVAAATIPFIMGLFGGNKFQVAGKVREGPMLE